MGNTQKKNLFKKIVFIIILIPTFLLIALICFTLIFGRQITEGAAKTVGNNFVMPIIAPVILVSKIINRNDKNGSKTAEEKVERNTQSDKTIGTIPTTKLPNELISEFDNKSTSVKADTFHVYFATDSNNNIINFKGKMIDSAYRSDLRKVFPKYDDYDAYHSTHSIDIDTIHVGYLIRRPAMYSSAAIDMLIYNKQNGCLLTPVNLSERFGDAEYIDYIQSWLFDFDNDSDIDIITRKQYEHYSIPDGARNIDSVVIEVKLWQKNEYIVTENIDSHLLKKHFKIKR